MALQQGAQQRAADAAPPEGRLDEHHLHLYPVRLRADFQHAHLFAVDPGAQGMVALPCEMRYPSHGFTAECRPSANRPIKKHCLNSAAEMRPRSHWPASMPPKAGSSA